MISEADLADRMRIFSKEKIDDKPLYQTLHQKNMEAVKKFTEETHDTRMIWVSQMMSVMSHAELVELLHIPAKERLEFMNRVYLKCKGE